MPCSKRPVYPQMLQLQQKQVQVGRDAHFHKPSHKAIETRCGGAYLVTLNLLVNLAVRQLLWNVAARKCLVRVLLAVPVGQEIHGAS
jgi:hypothetical protein